MLSCCFWTFKHPHLRLYLFSDTELNFCDIDISDIDISDIELNLIFVCLPYF